MDNFGQLPLTLAALEARLRRGEAFTIPDQGADGYTYALWFQEGRFFLRQGADLHPFHQVEPALFTLLNCLGEFSRSATSQGEGKHE